MMWKNLVSTAILAATLSFSGGARAESGGLSIDLPAQACTSGLRGEVCHHVFEKQKVRVHFQPAGKKAGCPKVSAELLQLSTRLEAPVPGAVAPAEAKLCAGGDFTVELPSLTNETEFEIVVSRETAKGESEALASIGLRAYPHTLLDAMKRWADDKNDALVISDADGRLADFLDRQKVAYLPRDRAAAGLRKVTIVVVPDPDSHPGEEPVKPEGDAVLLHEKIDTLPLVTVDHGIDHTTVDVRLRLLDALAADDPLGEKMLAEIFNEIAK